MAKQANIFTMQGTIGGVTFYKSKNGYLARGKGGIDAKRIANDPSYARTRENMLEFGRGCKAGKALRLAFQEAMHGTADKGIVSRLSKKMIEVIKADATSERGQRNVIDGEALLLENFEFNVTSPLSTAVKVPYVTTIDRVTGVLKVEVPAFTPRSGIVAPPGTTHIKLVCSGAAIDFENNVFESYTVSTPEMAYGNQLEAAFSLSNTVVANSTHPLFVALGVTFYQLVGGNFYVLNSGAFNALALVKVAA
jgi:hypothetical protein